MSYVYILRCSDGTLYTGHTDNLSSREQIHNDGFGSRYTASRRPVKVVYFEEFDSNHAHVAQPARSSGPRGVSLTARYLKRSV